MPPQPLTPSAAYVWAWLRRSRDCSRPILSCLVLELSKTNQWAPLPRRDPALRTLSWYVPSRGCRCRYGKCSGRNAAPLMTPSYLHRLIQDREHGHNPTCYWPLRRCVSLSRRQHSRNALFNALHRLSGTHYRKLFSVIVSLLQF